MRIAIDHGWIEYDGWRIDAVDEFCPPRNVHEVPDDLWARYMAASDALDAATQAIVDHLGLTVEKD